MEKDISANFHQKCLILCSKILINVLHNLNLKSSVTMVTYWVPDLPIKRILPSRRQTSWLCTSAAEVSNQGPRRTNPASGQSGSSRFRIWRPNHSATMPVFIHIVSLNNNSNSKCNKKIACSRTIHAKSSNWSCFQGIQHEVKNLQLLTQTKLHHADSIKSLRTHWLPWDAHAPPWLSACVSRDLGGGVQSCSRRKHS